MRVPDAELKQVLREQFGHEEFRPGQERVIRSLLGGKNVLAVLPTGAGKSLVYQLAAQLLPGVTLVVSPLLALMKDQAESIQARGLEVGVVNSAQSSGETGEALEKVERGQAKLLYVTPERFENPEFLAELKTFEVSLFVVDEAHCVSEWGYDFRPSYLALGDAIKRVGRPLVLALTATATPWVRRDISERLQMRDPEVVVHGVDRPNLFFEVRSVLKEEDDFRVLRGLFEGDEPEYPTETAARLRTTMAGSGIVYTSTTAAAVETAGWLRSWGIAADFYHGQRRKVDRERVQEAFMAGDLRVIAATNAFGLGVDKSDVRFVVHRDIPASIEAYYQEAGRAGRDGEFARCTLIYRPADLGRAAFMSATARLTEEDLRKIHPALDGRQETTLDAIAEISGLGKARVRRTLELLKQQEVVATRGSRVRVLQERFLPESIPLEAEEHRREYERSRLQMMRGYAEGWECRRRYVLNYFGEDMEGARCEFCDNDLSVERRRDTAAESAPFAPGLRVRHPEWGEGEVLASSDETITLRFDGAGEKKLAASLVRERGLLTTVALPTAAAMEPGGPFRVGDRVTHPQYGTGEVQRVAEESMTVLFDEHGYHTLDRRRVEKQGLLELEEERGAA